MPWKRGSDAVEAWAGCRTLWVGCRGSVGRMPYPENPNFKGLHIAGSLQKPPIGAVRRPPNAMLGKIWSWGEAKRASDVAGAWAGCRTLWAGCRGSVGRMPYLTALV